MKKAKNILYPVILICVTVVVVVLLSKGKNKEDSPETSPETNAEGEAVTYSEEELATIKEAKSKISSMGVEFFKGQYKDRPHSIMVNPDNITDGYTFFDPIRLLEYEFISYEELDDLSQYRTDIDPDDEMACYEYGFTSEYSTFVNYRKVINEDGTLNTIENITRERLLDGVYGDVVNDDKNHSYRPIKVTIRISNTTQVSQMVDVLDNNIWIQKLVEMDDENWYTYESLYNETLTIEGRHIYCSAQNRYAEDSLSAPVYITVGGNESVDIDYVFMIDDNEDMAYICMGVIEENVGSYYANYVKYFPLDNLKKLG